MSSTKVVRILIDCTFLFDQYSERGIGRVGKEVISRLIPLFFNNNVEVHIVSFDTLEVNLIKLGFSQFLIEELVQRIAFTTFGKPELSGVANLLRWEKSYKPVIEELKPDLFLAAHFERGLPTAKIFKNSLRFIPKTVVICHDVIPLKTNKYSNRGIFLNLIKKIFYKTLWNGVENADLIITSSNFSKSEILSVKDIDPEKIKVIYLGVSEKFYKKDIEQEYDEDLTDQIMELYNLKIDRNSLAENEIVKPDQLYKKYFFYDSGIEPNKGIFELITTFSKIQALQDSKIPSNLVIVGGDFTKGVGKSIQARNQKAVDILKLAKELNVLDKIITTGKIPDRDLILILSKAQFYINLSKYEGFGLGIIQAFAAEIPVIASNLTSYPEIAKAAAHLVDLEDLELTSKEIVQFIKNNKRISDNMEKGKVVAKDYNWDKASEEYFSVIYNLFQTSRKI